MSALTDTELIRLAQAGDGQAAGELVRRHAPQAWRAAFAITGSRELSEDALQDAFERLLRNLHRIDPERPFGAWLHRVVVNRSLDLVRSIKPGRPFDEELDASIDGGIESAMRGRELVSALGDLPPEPRAVVVLRILLGYSPTEIAAILDVEVGTVHSRLSRALASLRECLGVARGV